MDPKLREQPSPYYYNITGDAAVGDNKTDQTFSYTESRFPLNTRGEIFTQSTSWGDKDESAVSPMYQNIPGVVPAPFSVGNSTPTASNM